jgi:hypothetical protein
VECDLFFQAQSYHFLMQLVAEGDFFPMASPGVTPHKPDLTSFADVGCFPRMDRTDMPISISFSDGLVTACSAVIGSFGGGDWI